VSWSTQGWLPRVAFGKEGGDLRKGQRGIPASTAGKLWNHWGGDGVFFMQRTEEECGIKAILKDCGEERKKNCDL